MASQTTAPEPPPAANVETPAPTKEMLAERTIRENVLWAGGGALLPVPVLDVVAITAVELKMLKELSALYGLTFQEDQVKNILFSLAAGLGAPTIGAAVTASLLKTIPLIGSLSGLVAVPTFAAAFTYAVGKIFLQHFASGGTFLDFDPQKVREYFARQFDEGKLVVAKLRGDKTAQKNH
jgi:uncharacterized protein (DUF697 family)